MPPFGTDAPVPFTPAGPAGFVAPFYLRFVVADRPGILAELATVLARHDVNVDAVFQAPWSEKAELPFVVTLEPVDEERLGRALVELAALPFHVEPPLALPMSP
ncbi:MAG: ACT domain-containing protein [Holophagales bacterium]|nr:ACT domain-containing protein [Holophagales bacterium]